MISFESGGKIAAEPPASVNLKTVEKLEGGAWSKLADMAQERLSNIIFCTVHQNTVLGITMAVQLLKTVKARLAS